MAILIVEEVAAGVQRVDLGLPSGHVVTAIMESCTKGIPVFDTVPPYSRYSVCSLRLTSLENSTTKRLPVRFLTLNSTCLRVARWIALESFLGIACLVVLGESRNAREVCDWDEPSCQDEL